MRGEASAAAVGGDITGRGGGRGRGNKECLEQTLWRIFVTDDFRWWDLITRNQYCIFKTKEFERCAIES